MLVWQSVAPEFMDKWGATQALGNRFYEDFYEYSKANLEGYVDEKWLFVDAHGWLKQKHPDKKYSFHLPPDGQVILAELVARAIFEGSAVTGVRQ